MAVANFVKKASHGMNMDTPRLRQKDFIWQSIGVEKIFNVGIQNVG